MEIQTWIKPVIIPHTSTARATKRTNTLASDGIYCIYMKYPCIQFLSPKPFIHGNGRSILLADLFKMSSQSSRDSKNIYTSNVHAKNNRIPCIFDSLQIHWDVTPIMTNDWLEEPVLVCIRNHGLKCQISELSLRSDVVISHTHTRWIQCSTTVFYIFTILKDEKWLK